MNLGILALTLPFAAGAPPAPAVAPAAPPAMLPAPAMVPPPLPMAAPFTFVKVIVPEGAKTTWYPGTVQALVTASGTTVGLRPGYPYRFEVSGVGENKDARIWPSIEVRGAL